VPRTCLTVLERPKIEIGSHRDREVEVPQYCRDPSLRSHLGVSTFSAPNLSARSQYCRDPSLRSHPWDLSIMVSHGQVRSRVMGWIRWKHQSLGFATCKIHVSANTSAFAARLRSCARHFVLRSRAVRASLAVFG
jgi:hypothetical protein